jgi:hypothetical protein
MQKADAVREDVPVETRPMGVNGSHEPKAHVLNPAVAPISSGTCGAMCRPLGHEEPTMTNPHEDPKPGSPRHNILYSGGE